MVAKTVTKMRKAQQEEVAEDFFEVTVFVDLIEGGEGGRSIKLLEAKEG